MSTQVLFIHGGGDRGYEADAALAACLRAALGKEYDIHYPKIFPDEFSSDFGWMKQIGKQISNIKSDVIIAGHSFGASMILKYLSENSVDKKVLGIFLMATPFWSGNEDWKKGLKLQENFAGKLPGNIPVFFYQCLDDNEVSIDHLELYKEKIEHATFRRIQNGGHQFNNDLTVVAKDIKSLQN